MEPNGNIGATQEGATFDDANEPRIVAFDIEGMDCNACATRVQSALLALDGVVSADVDWESGLAFVDRVPSRISVDTLIRAVAMASDGARHTYRAQVVSQRTS